MPALSAGCWPKRSTCRYAKLSTSTWITAASPCCAWMAPSRRWVMSTADWRAKALMIQGTTSDAGKSTLAAGLCRVLAHRGVRVAPFKPQNMALNSAVTIDGGEIGRAQAVQAQAWYLAPHTDMNPILLKPNSDTGAQVIVHGRALRNMEAGAYQNYKHMAMQAVRD